jgi:hypothetical protein
MHLTFPQKFADLPCYFPVVEIFAHAADLTEPPEFLGRSLIFSPVKQSWFRPAGRAQADLG